MTNEGEEPTKYRVIFQSRNHERIMSNEELAHPSKQVYDGSSTTKADYYLCCDCVYEKRELALIALL